MALTYRQTKGSALTIQELDANFQYFTGSQAITGSLIVTQAITASSFSGSFTGSFLGTSSYATQALSASYAPNSGATVSTASLLTTASATNNIITFTKGDASTFAVTVATGSGGGSTNTGSLLTTASATNNVITFTKGDASTFAVTVATGSGGGSTNTGSLLITASAVANVITFTKGDASTFDVTVAQSGSVVSASYATQALSASYFSGSSGGATFTGDVNFTSGANVDGLFVVIPTDDSSVTSGLQVQRGEASPGDVQYTAINYQGGAGRLVGVNQHNNTPQLFIMLQDASANVSMMEFKTVFEAGIASAFIKINTSVLPTSEPSTSGQLWLSGSAGANSKLLAVRN